MLPTKAPPAPDLATLSLAEAPDFHTAMLAGEAHGLEPSEALKSAFGKWLRENHEAIQKYGVGNFYDGPEADRAMVNHTRLLQFVTITLADMGQKVARLESENAELRERLNP